MVDVIGWCGTVLFAWASILIAYKRRSSFIVLFIANLAYAVVGYLSDLTSLVAVSIFMCGMDVFGWWKWRS